MRLIDADRLKAAIHTDFSEHFTLYHDTDQTALFDMVMDDIDEMPTAFDKKRVIEKINREIEYHHEKSKIASMEIRAYSDGAERAYRLLRSIVEKGGIEWA